MDMRMATARETLAPPVKVVCLDLTLLLYGARR